MTLRCNPPPRKHVFKDGDHMPGRMRVFAELTGEKHASARNLPHVVPPQRSAKVEALEQDQRCRDGCLIEAQQQSSFGDQRAAVPSQIKLTDARGRGGGERGRGGGPRQEEREKKKKKQEGKKRLSNLGSFVDAVQTTRSDVASVIRNCKRERLWFRRSHAEE